MARISASLPVPERGIATKPRLSDQTISPCALVMPRAPQISANSPHPCAPVSLFESLDQAEQTTLALTELAYEIRSLLCYRQRPLMSCCLSPE